MQWPCKTRRGRQDTAVHGSKFTDKPFRKQCVLRPRAGLVATGAPLPLVAAPSLSPACPQSSATAAPAAAPAVGARAMMANQPGCRALWALGGPVERALQNPECPREAPLCRLWSHLAPGRGCAHMWQGHGIARWLGSWAFLPAPAKAGLHNGVAEKQLGRGQGESLLGKLGSSPSPHGLQVC